MLMNKLEVPPERYDNNCMMNEMRDHNEKHDDKERRAWVDQAISNFYWEFADDLSDSNSEKLDKLLNGELKDKVLTILKEEEDFWA
jgi:hypothetical protein